jgi:hypothetical protein
MTAKATIGETELIQIAKLNNVATQHPKIR